MSVGFATFLQQLTMSNLLAALIFVRHVKRIRNCQCSLTPGCMKNRPIARAQAKIIRHSHDFAVICVHVCHGLLEPPTTTQQAHFFPPWYHELQQQAEGVLQPSRAGAERTDRGEIGKSNE